VVVHPDYIGIGLGIRLATEASRIMSARGFRVKAKFTSPAMLKQRLGHPDWIYLGSKLVTSKSQAGNFGRTIRSSSGPEAAVRRNEAKLWGVKYHWFQFRSALEKAHD